MQRFQDAFVALVTDAPLRAAFLRDAAALAPFGLSPDEQAALIGIPRDRLVRYAESLLDKRQGEVARAVPLTTRIVPDLPQRYRRWLSAHPAPHADTVLPPGLSEALRALPALAAGLDDPEWAADLLVFEVYRRASRLDAQPRFLDTPWPVHAIASDLSQGGIPDPAPGRHTYRFPLAAR
jgi:hypothetical protein